MDKRDMAKRTRRKRYSVHQHAEASPKFFTPAPPVLLFPCGWPGFSYTCSRFYEKNIVPSVRGPARERVRKGGLGELPFASIVRRSSFTG